jgi:hypothetical protein
VITLNYIAIADPHTLEITTSHAKTFQFAVSSPVVSWSRPLTVGILQLHRPSLPFTDSLTTDLQLTLLQLIIF